jgi:hypothetical protein
MTDESIKIQRRGYMPMRYRIGPFVTPWLLIAGVFITSAITHAFCSGPLALMFLAFTIAGLVWVTWTTWDRRHKHARNAATAFAAVMGVWLATATATSPIWPPMLYAFAMGGGFMALTWDIRYAGITPSNKHDRMAGDMANPYEAIKRLKDAVPVKVKEGNGKVQIILQHHKGKSTTADVQAARENIAGIHAVDGNSVSVAKVKGRGDQTGITVRIDDPTEQVVRWPGVSAPGKSIADAPLRIGVREDGQPMSFWVTGDDLLSRAAPHTLWTGMTGSGKTAAFILGTLEMISRIDCAPVVADPEKFMLSFGGVMDAFAIAADGPEQTEQLIANLPPALRYRASLLGSLGYEQWEPECWTKYGIPVVPVHIEEAAGYLATNKDFNKAIILARALGMPISASLQVAVFRNLQREARSQFGNSIAFGVKEKQDAQFALTDGTLNAGADPTRWGNNEPGRCYAETVGVPSEEWAVKARTFKITPAERRASIEMADEAGRARIDEGTFDLLSRGIHRPVRMVGVPQIPDLSQAPTVELPTVADRPTLTMVKNEEVPGERPPPDVAREMMMDRLSELEDAGKTIVVVADFAPVADLLERHRTWPYTELRRIERTGRVEKVKEVAGQWRIVPKAMIKDQEKM